MDSWYRRYPRVHRRRWPAHRRWLGTESTADRVALGRIWISTSRGLSVLGPNPLLIQSAPAIPHLQAVVVDGVNLPIGDRLKVPALSKRVVFDFIGISLSEPQRLQYQFRLDKFDSDWSKPIAIREAAYTNLPPGNYRFRLRTRNPAGVWSEHEGQPRDSSGARVLADLVVPDGSDRLYTFALCRRLSKPDPYGERPFESSLRERLTERTRIAQELHDTVLQGFLSASMQLPRGLQSS